MFKKLCSNCERISYSSYDDGKWLCPVCKHDLTYVKAYVAPSRNNPNPKLYIIKKSMFEQNSCVQPEVFPYVFKLFDSK